MLLKVIHCGKIHLLIYYYQDHKISNVNKNIYKTNFVQHLDHKVNKVY